VTIKRLERESILNFLHSLSPPVHVILFYVKTPELVDIESKIAVQRSVEAETDATDQVRGANLTKDDINNWAIRNVNSEDLSNPEKLIEIEERISETRQPPQALCAYPLKKALELDKSILVKILSLHDYVLFSRFAEGGEADTGSRE